MHCPIQLYQFKNTEILPIIITSDQNPDRRIHLEHRMKSLWDGVKGIVRKNNRILVLVKQNGKLDLPGGRVENGETIQSALQSEINE